MGAAVLLDEAAEGIDLAADRDAGDVIAWDRERRFQRPLTALRIEHLMEIAVDAMARVAGDDVNLARAFDDGVFAGRNRKPRLLDPAAGVLRHRRDARHVALLLHARRNLGDLAIVETREQRIGGFGGSHGDGPRA